MSDTSIEFFLAREDLVALDKLVEAHASGDRNSWLREQIRRDESRLREERLVRRAEAMRELHAEIHTAGSKVYTPSETRALIDEICAH